MKECIKKFFTGFISCFEYVDKYYENQEQENKLGHYWPKVSEYLNNSFKKIANYE